MLGGNGDGEESADVPTHDGHGNSDSDSPAVFYFRYEDSEDTVYLYDDSFWDDAQEGHDTADEEPLTVSQVQSQLLSIVHPPISRLHVTCEQPNTWKALNETSTWREFCQAIQQCLPHVTRLEVEQPHNLSDAQCVALFRHLAPNSLTHLTMNVIGGNLPGMFRQIGRSFPQLQELILMGNADWEMDEDGFEYHSVMDDTNGQCLGDSLHCLSKLKKVSIAQFVTCNPQVFWEPVWSAIRSNPNLQVVQFRGGYHFCEDQDGEAYSFEEFPVEEDILNDLQYGPRLNQAERDCLRMDETEKEASSFSLQQWVEALISVRDRVDCLDYFLSTTDPNLYAWSAIGEGGARHNT
ncbi:expressed unknown protein [Seminavis robusta]|uniref:Uncharacterized protein n=1 Tax=Seminavis robusta TaxID=568900 RepID=A0A9N8HPT4_9STRA|nr:expressed unknown protein [Seminavis robusta]|eukprot:Sro1101_g241370.1 n/a (351) ;mRNA; r:5964-7016